MYIKTLKLNNYRNIKNSSIEFSRGINIIYGGNAQGKTNVVESIFLCSTGRSHRSRIDRELILIGEKSSNVRVIYSKNGFDDNIEVSLKHDEKKGIAVNGRSIRLIGELFGELQTVIFSPEDLSIVNDSPSERRRFMDMQICQISKIYYYHLQTYYKVLKQRNSLLKKKEQKNIRENLLVWDAQLIAHGKEIIKIRRWFIDSISPIAGEIQKILTDNKEELVLEYKPSADYESFESKLFKSVDKDIIYGSTSIGPHKDDVIFYIDGRDAKTYGSQGQKRTVALSCKLAEIEIVKGETGDTPVLLLDDVFSELDSGRQEMLIKYISDIQTIVTATGVEDLITKIKDSANLLYVCSGNIEEVSDEWR